MELRAAISRLTSYRCTWTSEEVAALTDSPLRGARAYLTSLVTLGVLSVDHGNYSPGPGVKKWKSHPPKKKGPSTYGNSRKYREQRALWDKLRQRDWEEAKKGKTLTLGEATDHYSVRQKTAGDDLVTKSINGTGCLTPDEAAAELSLSVETVRRQIRSGKIAAFRAGSRCLRISRESLEAYRLNNLIACDRAKK
jgi:excisionase family DNA binding protein